ncbi:MAG: cycloisomerase [Acidobacteria bacterium]|nr:cycloisomerase [Acidobacteriota bacterium]
MMRRSLAASLLAVACPALALLAVGQPPARAQAASFTLVAEFAAPEAGQGVAVDRDSFYAVDSRAIARYDKRTGTRRARWQEEADGPITHLDGAVVLDGRLYAAHSNYPQWPMTSSLEIWDAASLAHIGSRSFGINWGSLTWADFHDGAWWMTFANYDQPVGPDGAPYGRTAATQLIKFTSDFRMLEGWVLPKAVLSRLGVMSNSGGSWGPDGWLYLTGHDPAEVYRMRLPKAGSVLELADIVPLPIRGQGLAWDRTSPGVLYTTFRATAEERRAGGGNKVRVFRMTKAAPGS